MLCNYCHIEVDEVLDLGCFAHCDIIKFLRAKKNDIYSMVFMFNGVKRTIKLSALHGEMFELDMTEIPICAEVCFYIEDSCGERYSYEFEDCNGLVKSYCEFKMTSVISKINDPIIEDDIDIFAKECGKKPFISEI